MAERRSDSCLWVHQGGKQQAEESYLSEETMLAQEEMGINRQALEIPSNRNSEDTWKKIRPIFKIKIMKRDYMLSVAAGISCTGGPSSISTKVILLLLLLILRLASNSPVPLHQLNSERELDIGCCYQISVTRDAPSVWWSWIWHVVLEPIQVQPSPTSAVLHFASRNEILSWVWNVF